LFSKWFGFDLLPDEAAAKIAAMIEKERRVSTAKKM
jgi:hypothetical protein